MDIGKIEEKIDRTAAGKTAIDMALGGVRFQSMIELMEFAKLMAVSDLAVPVHLRGNPGACLAVCTKALRFGFDPFSLAEHSYAMVKNEKDDNNQWHKVETIAYDSFVIRAIIEAHAPIQGRIRYGYDGEGDARTCTATVVERATGEVLDHTSPTLGDLKAARGRNDKGKIKGSPLWETKPDMQLAYDTGRDLCRKHFPAILLGVYDKDEMEEYGPATAKDVTPAKPTVGEHLKGQGTQRGFNAEHVERETAGAQQTKQQQQSLPAPSAETTEMKFDAGKPGPEKVPVTAQAQPEKRETQEERSAPTQNAGTQTQNPGEMPDIPPKLRRTKDKADAKPKDEPVKQPVLETVDEEGIMKTLTDTLHNARQQSIQGKDDGVALQAWQKSAAVVALRSKLSKENNDKIGAAVRAVWDEIL